MVYNKKKRKYVIPLNSKSQPHLIKGENEIKIICFDANNNQSKLVTTVIY